MRGGRIPEFTTAQALDLSVLHAHSRVLVTADVLRPRAPLYWRVQVVAQMLEQRQPPAWSVMVISSRPAPRVPSALKVHAALERRILIGIFKLCDLLLGRKAWPNRNPSQPFSRRGADVRDRAWRYLTVD